MFQQGNFKILQLLPQVLILFLVEKWISPNRSETVEIGKKIERILGVKSRYGLKDFRFLFLDELSTCPQNLIFTRCMEP
jgi:hypothetical protein